MLVNKIGYGSKKSALTKTRPLKDLKKNKKYSRYVKG